MKLLNYFSIRNRINTIRDLLWYHQYIVKISDFYEFDQDVYKNLQLQLIDLTFEYKECFTDKEYLEIMNSVR